MFVAYPNLIWTHFFSNKLWSELTYEYLYPYLLRWVCIITYFVIKMLLLCCLIPYWGVTWHKVCVLFPSTHTSEILCISTSSLQSFEYGTGIELLLSHLFNYFRHLFVHFLYNALPRYQTINTHRSTSMYLVFLIKKLHAKLFLRFPHLCSSTQKHHLEEGAIKLLWTCSFDLSWEC